MRSWLPAVLVAVALALVAPVAADQSDSHLDWLFARLKATENQSEAKAIEAAIWNIWNHAGDPELDRQMRDGLEAMERGEAQAALDIFERMVVTAPAFAEAWNKRATMYYFMNRYPESIRDVERTLALEPRHFGAIVGLGQMLLESGREQEALVEFEKALAIDPHLTIVRMKVDELRRHYPDRPI